MSNKIAVVRIRGSVKVDSKIKETMKRLGLVTQNTLVILPDTKEVKGMLEKAKDYITWGPVTDETITLVKSKKKPFIEKENKIIFRLNPPRGGYERKGIKTPFSLGGALGNRGDKINDLIKKMIE